MTDAFDILVLFAFFAPMALLVALNLATLRPPLRPGMPHPPPRPQCAAGVAPQAPVEAEALREAA
jgi:hypothetical protein